MASTPRTFTEPASLARYLGGGWMNSEWADRMFAEQRDELSFGAKPVGMIYVTHATTGRSYRVWIQADGVGAEPA